MERGPSPSACPSAPPADTATLTPCRHAAPSRHGHDTANGTPCGTANGTANGTAKPPAAGLLRDVHDTANGTDRGTNHDTDRGTHFYINNNNKILFAGWRAIRDARANTHSRTHARTRNGLRPRCARPAAEQPTATRKPPLQPQDAR